MNMKEHILAALREEFDQWEELLERLGEAQIIASDLPSRWSIKDTITHLWAWQQRSIARMEAALSNREPVFPSWLPDVDPEVEGNTDQINAWIFQTYHEQPWSRVHQNWREGFLRLLDSYDDISERDMLDSEKYPWLEGYSLANVLLGTYDHHQEHLEKLLAWLKEQ